MSVSGRFAQGFASLLRGLGKLLLYPYIRAVRAFPRAARILCGATVSALLAFIVLQFFAGSAWLVRTGWQAALALDTHLSLPRHFPGFAPSAPAEKIKESPVPLPLVTLGAPPWRQGVNATVRGYLSADTLPYKEGKLASLGEHSKQADYALIQALQRLDLPWSSLVLVSVASSKVGGEPFMLQRLQAYIPLQEGAFVKQLQEALTAWAEGSELLRVAPGKIHIAYKGQVSHEIVILDGVKPFIPSQDGPRISIVIDDLGPSLEPVQKLLSLDIPFVYAIMPETQHASEIAQLVRTHGHEVIVHQPAEPLDKKQITPGIVTLKATMSAEEIAAHLAKSLERVPGAVALNNHTGSRFTQNRKASRALSAAAAVQGLFVIDSVTHSGSVLASEASNLGVRAYSRNIFLDDKRESEAIAEKLAQAETLARKHGQALVIGHPYQETLDVLAAWAKTRDTDIEIVPVRFLQSLPFIHGAQSKDTEIQAGKS